ncbi:MAG: hypothetical protein HY293_11245, partial [Planctomycetes bacterium]|nr:hypothetical protein [Planctomycetota bacterium]
AAGGRTFVATEHVQGMSLATAPRNDRGRRALAIREAAEAVAALHARGLFHGALSLETILLDDRDAVRVVGWGPGRDDVRALGAALFEILSDRPAPATGVPKTWPKRLDGALRSILTKALSGRTPTAAGFARDLQRALR